MSWLVSPWIYPDWDSLCFLDLIDYFLSHVRELFNCSLFKYFLRPFFFSSSSGTPVIQMLVCLMLSHRSLRLSSIPFILFSLFCSAVVYFHYFIFQVTYHMAAESTSPESAWHWSVGSKPTIAGSQRV